MTLTSFSVTLIRDLGTLIGDLGTLIRNLGALIHDLVTVIHNLGALISDLGTLICDLGALIRDVRNLIRDLNTLAKAPGAGADNTLLGSAIHWYRGGLLYTYLRQRWKIIKKRRKKTAGTHLRLTRTAGLGEEPAAGSVTSPYCLKIVW